ncbi:uncharacterized protein LOC131428968 [Malaya genurostris]|uniref:uncharacterized protein LOC131428968 n=1 Tax=Malaya genurostris TaxID=325434 RepID=UPI0026F3EB16|nr:uncharacterized protein LOC131428968 [Malaya genurostris]
MKLTRKSIIAIRDTGLIPIALVMDQSTTNQKMIREAGGTAEHPIIQVDNEDIAVMFDPPHLLKNARNALYKYNAVFEDQIASFNHIKLLFETDVASTLRLAPKLLYKAIQLPPFSKMNVSIATRTLSESCAIAIRHYVEIGSLPTAALQSASFIALHDKLFDTFNSKERYVNSIGKPYRTPITDNSVHLKFLEETQRVFKTMYYTVNTCFNIKTAKKLSRALTSAQKRPVYLKGFIGNINALKWILNTLKEQYSCNYLCTNPLCQDCLENFFSEIRRRCGFNEAPNAFQFCTAFKYAMISSSKSSNISNDGMNCENDRLPFFLNEEDLEETFTAVSNTPTFDFEPLNVDAPYQFLAKDINALIYIIGAAVHKLPHARCRSVLKIEQDNASSHNEDYAFCKLKSQFSFRQINIPNNKLYDIGLVSFAKTC